MTLEPLTSRDQDDLARSLTLAAQLARTTPPLGVTEVQELYDELLEDDPGPDAIAALGAAFGAVLVADRPYEWVRVNDEWGSELAVGVFGLQLSCHPISMIERRLKKREPVDIALLARTTIEQLEAVIAQGPDRRPMYHGE